MSLQLTTTLVECAPGNTVQISGTGFGASGSLVLGNQLLLPPQNATPVYTGLLSISPSAWTTTAASFAVPDGVTSGTLTVTAQDASTATVPVRVESQYVQASEYIGEGVDTSGFAVGELDQILRDASGYVDAYIRGSDNDLPGLRYLQRVETPKFRPRPKGAPKIWLRRRPVQTVDQITFITSNQIRTSFNVSQTTASDVYVNKDTGSFDMLAYAFGNYALLGAIETIGFSANIIEVVYTAGYKWLDYPLALRKATKMVATELMVYRGIIAQGLGGLSRVRENVVQYDRRNEEFTIPAPAKELLRKFNPPVWA